MYVVGHFIKVLAVVFYIVLRGFMFIIIARAILSWVSPDPYNPIVRFIHNVTEPILDPIRRRLPFHTGGIDISPIIVFLVIYFLQIFVVDSLMDLSESFLHKSSASFLR
jgi:YggT family protein